MEDSSQGSSDFSQNPNEESAATIMSEKSVEETDSPDQTPGTEPFPAWTPPPAQSSSKKMPIIGICLAVLAVLGFMGLRFLGGAAVYKLTAGDKAKFIEHENNFTTAQNHLDSTIGTATDPSTIKASSAEDLNTMQSELDAMRTFSKKLKEEPKEIATDIVAAGEKILKEYSAVVDAFAASNQEEVTAAATRGQSAVNEFNAAITEWNALQV